MQHLLTMKCTVSNRALGGTDEYNRPTADWEDAEDTKCLYQAVNYEAVEMVAGTGVRATGKLYFMPTVTVHEGSKIGDVVKGAAVVEAGPMKVLRVLTETSPNEGAHHKVVFVGKGE